MRRAASLGGAALPATCWSLSMRSCVESSHFIIFVKQNSCVNDIYNGDVAAETLPRANIMAHFAALAAGARFDKGRHRAERRLFASAADDTAAARRGSGTTCSRRATMS